MLVSVADRPKRYLRSASMVKANGLWDTVVCRAQRFRKGLPNGCPGIGMSTFQVLPRVVW
jgi:hypothetical protein